ncbi:YhcH/YjgK/YiaL family protein [Vibrio sp. DW001]|jgi:biofilm protein TabA|uniref:YhcH/YjgK/YiaL family protein n=1 Tax=Vibrio sp. DW001 TaxID=2912315 RepID=UPI0023B07592|nr:YhcH/YjgK/YiaL family protein [Vibrio sp. DW001]WED26307.1 YhcH/YjgK/YiaL family protein [Vibrio sp. DW001]
MLFGNVKKLDLVPYMSEKFVNWINEAIALSENNDLGKYMIGDDGVFVMLVDGETEPRALRKSEIHKQYIDIQILLSGEEVYGYSNTISEEALKLVELENDVMFFDNVENEQFIKLQDGDFVIFYPNQAHRPLCASNDKPMVIKKAILKIPSSVL